MRWNDRRGGSMSTRRTWRMGCRFCAVGSSALSRRPAEVCSPDHIGLRARSYQISGQLHMAVTAIGDEACRSSRRERGWRRSCIATKASCCCNRAASRPLRNSTQALNIAQKQRRTVELRASVTSARCAATRAAAHEPTTFSAPRFAAGFTEGFDPPI